MIIHNCLTTLDLTKRQSRLLRVLSTCMLNTDRCGARTSPLGSLLQCFTTFLVKKCFLISSLSLLWCSFEAFPHVLSLDPREKGSACPSLGAVKSNEVTPHRSHLPALSPALFLFSRCSSQMSQGCPQVDYFQTWNIWIQNPSTARQ